MGHVNSLVGVPVPIGGRPEVTLRLVVQYQMPSGCTIIEYTGDDGNIYHELLGKDDGSIWTLTRS